MCNSKHISVQAQANTKTLCDQIRDLHGFLKLSFSWWWLGRPLAEVPTLASFPPSTHRESGCCDPNFAVWHRLPRSSEAQVSLLCAVSYGTPFTATIWTKPGIRSTCPFLASDFEVGHEAHVQRILGNRDKGFMSPFSSKSKCFSGSVMLRQFVASFFEIKMKESRDH